MEMETQIADAGISRSAFASLFLTVFLDSFGFMMVFSYLYFFAKSLGASPLVYGALLAGYAIMQLVFSPILGKLSDKLGRRRVLIISTFGTGLSLLIFGMANSLAMLFIARAVSGVMGATFPIAQAYVSDTTDQKGRFKYMALLGAGLGLGLAVGPAVGGLLSATFGYAVPSISGAALGFINCAMTYLRLPEPPRLRKTDSKVSFRSALSQSGLKMILCTYFLFFLAFLVISTTYSPWASDRLGFGPLEVGLNLFYIGSLLVVVQGMLIPRISSKFSPSLLMAGGLFMFVIGLVTLSLTDSVQTLIAANSMLAFGYGLTVPSISTMISTIASGESRGATFGIAQSLQGGAQVVSPILGNLVLAMGVGSGFLGLASIISMGIMLPPLAFGVVFARNSSPRLFGLIGR